MGQLRIELVDSDEALKATAELASRIWMEHYAPIIGEGQVRYMLERFQSAEAIAAQISPGGYVYNMAYWGETPAGYCAFQKGVAGVFLSKLYIDKPFRKKGIARQFLGLIKENAPGLPIWLTVNKHNGGSIKAYERLGFKIVESLATDIGGGYLMDDYKMVLTCYTRGR